MIAWALSFFAGRRPLGMALLAAGRRGGRSCGPALRRLPPPWPPLRAPPAPCSPPPGVCAGANKVGRMGSPRRWRGSAAACPRPRRGRSRAAPGRSLQPLQPPWRASAHTGGRGPPFPPRRPLGRSSGAVLRRPRLRRVGALACSAPCLSAAWSFFPRRFLPQPSPLPPPVPLPLRGRGKRKRLTPAAAGTGGARLPQRAKKPPRLWLLPPAKRHKTRILCNFAADDPSFSGHRLPHLPAYLLSRKMAPPGLFYRRGAGFDGCQPLLKRCKGLTPSV